MTNKRKMPDAAFKNYFLSEISAEKKNLPEVPMITASIRKEAYTQKSTKLFRSFMYDFGFAAVFLFICTSALFFFSDKPSHLALTVTKSIESGAMKKNGNELANNLELIAIEGHKWAISKASIQ